ncbi:radical SAM protein [Candidatus Bipolaricaulota bacterium]|nr:radical SAM protein [Candidatus Bipolaricaulota bacterium]
MDNHGFGFCTENESRYFYNDCSGCVIPHSNLNKQAQPEQTPTYSEAEDISPEMKLDCSSVHDALIDRSQGFHQLVLVVTRDCNLRCKYCVYSEEKYENMPTLKGDYMTVDTAKKAIKKYFRGFRQVKQVNPSLSPTISFYGGEPLLNFELIKEVVSFSNGKYSGNITFNITTNGVLLSETIIDFFAKHNFFLSISLNGPQSEHNRLRVFPTGKGTFGEIWENLQMLREKHPTYDKRGCGILACYDHGTDLEDLSLFFEEHKETLPPLLRLSPVSASFSNWYDRYSEHQKEKFSKQRENLKETYFSELAGESEVSILLDKMFGFSYKNILMRPQRIKHPHPLKYTATCIPGQKISVNPDGSFHACEKVNDQFPIGNVEQGLNIAKVVDRLKTYKSNIFPECSECSITRLCSVCMATFAGKDAYKRSPPDLCVKLKRDFKTKFEELWTKLENGLDETRIIGVSGHSNQDIQCDRGVNEIIQ